MSRRYRKSRRDPGLFEIAATSDWKVSAAMAAVCAFAAAVFIPALFGNSRVLGGLVPVFSPLAWLMAVLFGSISLIRFFRQRAPASPPPPRPAAARQAQSAVRAIKAPLSELDKALLEKSFGPAPAPMAQEAHPTVWSRALIDRIEWKRFEDLCCEFYRVKGIRAETTALGADGGDWTTPTCPSCGVKMAARDSKRGRFWGCVRLPKCRASLQMRTATP